MIKETYCRALAHLGGIEGERSVKRDPRTQEKRPVTLMNETYYRALAHLGSIEAACTAA
jgi:hypothetical protein